jgi:hypothetical protein
MNLNWNPTTFEDAIKAVQAPVPGVRYNLAQFARNLDGLPCPAPGWDAEGRYAVRAVDNEPVIQKQVGDGTWATAELTPPSDDGKAST